MHQGAGNPAEVPEGILQAADELIGRLPPHRLAVALARVAEHNPQHMRSTLARPPVVGS